MHGLREQEKRSLCKGLGFSIPPKKIDFLTQFEFLYRDTTMFEMKSENYDFLKNKLKDICFSTLKLYRSGDYSIKKLVDQR